MWQQLRVFHRNERHTQVSRAQNHTGTTVLWRAAMELNYRINACTISVALGFCFYFHFSLLLSVQLSSSSPAPHRLCVPLFEPRASGNTFRLNWRFRKNALLENWNEMVNIFSPHALRGRFTCRGWPLATNANITNFDHSNIFADSHCVTTECRCCEKMFNKKLK